MRLVSPYRFVKFALARLRFAYDGRNAGVDTVALGRRVFALIQEVVYFVKFELLAQSLMRARLFRLFCKRFELAFEFRGNIDYTRNVVARSVEFTHGFKPFSLGFGNTYGLFEYSTAIFGFTRKYFGNLTLSDYGVTLFAYAAFVQTIDYIAESCGIFVYVVFAVARTEQFTGKYHFVVIEILEYAGGIVESQRNLAVRKRFTALSTVEYNVLHTRAAHGFCRLLAKHPPYRVRDVTLTAAVGTDYTGNAVIEHYFLFIGKRFKADQFNFFKVHLYVSP